MKKTNTPILRTLALSLLIVVTLASFTNVLSAGVVHAQEAATADAPPPPAEAPAAPAAADATPPPAADATPTPAPDAKPATAPAKTPEQIAAIDKIANDKIAAAQKIYDTKKDVGTDADKAAALKELNAAKDAAYKERTENGGTPYAAGSSGSGGDLTTLGGQSVGDLLGNNNDIIVMLSKLLAVVLSMISHMLWPLLMFAGGLMKSDFLYTGAIDLKLSEMWIQVRNLVNIAYVLLLLAVALYNVVGLGETVSMLELKKALPKIILGLILVNFSYAGVKVVLDVINVGTTFAFSIGRTDARLTQATMLKVAGADSAICDTLGGGQLAEGLGKEAKDAELAKCSKETNPQKCVKDIEISHKSRGGSSNAMCVDNGGKLGINPKVKQYLKSWNVDSSLMIIAIKFMNIQDLPKVSAAAASGGITKLTINMLFSVVMFLIYAVSFIVLVVVLFARAAILWMIIIFSPVIVLNATFAIPGVGGNSSKIVKTLIAPMLIGFVLSIGFILLATMQNINYQGQGTLTSGAPTSSIDTFQDLLVAIGSIVFLWIGIQTATSDTISDKITGPILEGAQSAGTWLAKAPFKYAPLFQVATPHAGHHELQGMGKIGVDLIPGLMHEMVQEIDNKRTQAGRDLLGIGHSAQPLEQATNPDALKNLLGERGKTAQYYLSNQQELIAAVKKIGLEHPEYRTPGNPNYKPEFHELHKEAVAGKLTLPNIQKFMPTPAAATPAATPAATKAPAEVSTDMKREPTVIALVDKLNDPSPATVPTVAETADAIAKFNKELVDGGTADAQTKGKTIAQHFKTQGVNTPANITKSKNAMTACLAALKAKNIMTPKEADDLIREINSAL